MTTAVFGGSFNPVHNGHIAIAEYIADAFGLSRVLMMLSPLNPLKQDRHDLIDDAERYRMLELACTGHDRLEPCDIELSMPRPTYTIDTLRHITRTTGMRPRVIIGGDNWSCFGRWRAGDEIIRDYGLIVYPRPGETLDAASLPDGVSGVPGVPPLYDVSSTAIRRAIRGGEPLPPGVLAPDVLSYIVSHNLYI